MTEAIHAERREPEQPDAPFDLNEAASELLDSARNLSAGRASRTITPSVGGPLKQTILALCEGRQLDAHTAPGPATILVLTGTVTLSTGGDETRLTEGQWGAIPAAEHDLKAEADAAVLLTVALPQ